jgi:hypothetical protein
LIGSVAAGVLLAVGLFVGITHDSDEEEIADTVAAFALADDPDWCGVATQRYLEETTGLPGVSAYEDCARDVEEGRGRPDQVDVDEIQLHEDGATAVVTYRGGPLDGSSIKIALIEAARGRWMLDHSLALVNLDRDGLREGFAETLNEDPGGLPRAAADCVVAAILRGSDQEIEDILLGSDSTGLILRGLECDRRAYERALLQGMAADGYPPAVGRCAGAAFARRNDRELAEFILDPVAFAETLIGCDREASLSGYPERLAADGLSEPEIDCVMRSLGELSDAQLAQTSVDGTELDRIYGECT